MTPTIPPGNSAEEVCETPHRSLRGASRSPSAAFRGGRDVAVATRRTGAATATTGPLTTTGAEKKKIRVAFIRNYIYCNTPPPLPLPPSPSADILSRLHRSPLSRLASSTDRSCPLSSPPPLLVASSLALVVVVVSVVGRRGQQHRRIRRRRAGGGERSHNSHPSSSSPLPL